MEDSRESEDAGGGGQNSADDETKKEERLRNYKPQRFCTHGSKMSYFCRQCRDEYEEYVSYKRERGEPHIEYKYAFCVHDKQRKQCGDCNGRSLCDHKTQRSKCSICKPSVGQIPKTHKKKICDHGMGGPQGSAVEDALQGFGVADELQGFGVQDAPHGFEIEDALHGFVVEDALQALEAEDELQDVLQDVAEDEIWKHIDWQEGERVTIRCRHCSESLPIEHFPCNDLGLTSTICNTCTGNMDISESEQKSKKSTRLCPHNANKSWCIECGTKNICSHGRTKYTCKECGGKGICTHGKIKRNCKECGTFCSHGRRKNTCRECDPDAFCSHNKLNYLCKECGGKGICAHGKLKRNCKDCGTFCSHGRLKHACKECGGKAFCLHGTLKYLCKPCKGKGICAHDKQKRTCKVCKGSLICSHGKNKQRCKDCKQQKASTEMIAHGAYVKCAGGCSKFVPRHDGASSSSGPDPSLCADCQGAGLAGAP